MRGRSSLGDGMEEVRDRAGVVQRPGCPYGVPAAARAAVAATESATVRERLSGFRVQHFREFRYQHQLARLLGRVDHELPHADGGARRAEFPLGGDRDIYEK